MRLTLLVTALLTASFAVSQPADAQSAKKKPRQTEQVLTQPGTNSFAPPRMIEVRPGMWISSYGCVMDDGKHGLMSCSSSGNIF